MFQNYSIKASKNISNITLINKRHKQKHFVLDTNYIIVYINIGKICIFPGNIIPKKYINDKKPSIEFRSSIYNKVLKNSRYVYSFQN